MQALQHLVPRACSSHRQPTPMPETHVHSQASLCQSLVGSLLLSPGSWCTQGFVCALQESVSQSCVNSIIRSHCPPKSNSLGFSVSLPDPQVGKSDVGPRTFLTVWEFVWHNCSTVCGLSARHLYGGVNGDLLHEGLCHTQECCTQSPCPCGRPLLTRNSTGDIQTLNGMPGSVSVRSPVAQKALFEPSDHLW